MAKDAVAESPKCERIAACVELAQKTPRRFPEVLRELVSRLPVPELEAGARYQDPNPRLASYVRHCSARQLVAVIAAAPTPELAAVAIVIAEHAELRPGEPGGALKTDREALLQALVGFEAAARSSARWSRGAMICSPLTLRS